MAIHTHSLTTADYQRQLTRGFGYLRFEPALEKAFRQQQCADGIQRLRAALAVSIVLLLVALPLDLPHLDGSVESLYLWVRLGIAVPLIGVMYGLTHIARIHDCLATLTAWVLAVFGITTAYLLVYARQAGQLLPDDVINLLTIICFLLAGLFFWQAIVCVAAITGSYLIFSQTLHPTPEPLHNLYFLLATLLVGSASAYLLEYQFRVSFLQGRLLVISQEKERHRVQQEAELAQRTSRLKSDFVATVSHEIRTPMNGIIGIADVLSEMPLPDTAAYYIRVLQRSGSSLLTILNDVLDFSKIEAGKLDIEFAPFLVRPLIEDCLATVACHPDLNQLRLDSTIEPSVPAAIMGDAHRIRQILVNFLSNAIKFTAQGSISLDVFRRHDGIVFQVTDTGKGLTLEQQSQLFKPYAQTGADIARQFGGTGLGLAIAKQLAELMDGKVGVNSTPDKGATFWLRLPYVPAPAAEPLTYKAERNVRTQRSHKTWSQVRVLVAEDNPTSQLVIQGLLKHLDIAPCVVDSGRQAVEQICRTTAHYDLVLMDVNMPDMDGLTATRHIRDWELQHQRHTRIIGLSAHAQGEKQLASTDAGMDEFLEKPVRMAKLEQLLTRLFASDSVQSR